MPQTSNRPEVTPRPAPNRNQITPSIPRPHDALQTRREDTDPQYRRWLRMYRRRSPLDLYLEACGLRPQPRTPCAYSGAGTGTELDWEQRCQSGSAT